MVPAEVMMAKQILSRLGDYSAMAEDDDVVDNVRALAGLLVSLGNQKSRKNSLSLVFTTIYTYHILH